jgi:hypothetical protein
MDPKLLADAVMIMLAPALPHLVTGGTELVKAAGKKLGEEGTELVGKLWGLLQGKVEERPAAKAMAEEVAKAPEDDDARVGLRGQLLKILEADPELASEVVKLLESGGRGPVTTATVYGSGAIAQGKGAVAAGAGGQAAGRDINNSPKRGTGEDD